MQKSKQQCSSELQASQSENGIQQQDRMRAADERPKLKKQMSQKCNAQDERVFEQQQNQ